MSSEDLIVQLMQVLKNDETSLKQNHVIINAQLQYNLKLQESVKKLAAEYDAQKKKTKLLKKRKR